MCHKEAWQSLWQLAESCVEHNRHKRPSSLTVSSCTVGEGMKNSSCATCTCVGAVASASACSIKSSEPLIIIIQEGVLSMSYVTSLYNHNNNYCACA